MLRNKHCDICKVDVQCAKFRTGLRHIFYTQKLKNMAFIHIEYLKYM